MGVLIGRVLGGLSELIVVGMPSRQCAHLINHVAEDWDRVLRWELDETVQLLPVPELVVATTDDVLDACRFAQERGLHDELQVTQILSPDRTGRFPWDPASDSAMRRSQPILGLVNSTGA